MQGTEIFVVQTLLATSRVPNLRVNDTLTADEGADREPAPSSGRVFLFFSRQARAAKRGATPYGMQKGGPEVSSAARASRRGGEFLARPGLVRFSLLSQHCLQWARCCERSKMRAWGGPTEDPPIASLCWE